MSYGQKLIHGEGTSQGGPLSVLQQCQPHDPLNTVLVWSYLILSDTHICFPVQKEERRAINKSAEIYLEFHHANVDSLESSEDRFLFHRFLFPSKALQKCPHVWSKKNCKPGRKMDLQLAREILIEFLWHKKEPGAREKNTPLTCHSYWLFNMDPYDGLV